MNSLQTSLAPEFEPQKAHLTGEQQTAMHDLYQRLFAEIHDGNTTVPSYCFKYGLRSMNPAPENEIEACQEIAVIFCHELIKITKEMHTTTGSLTSLKTLRFLQIIRTAYFNAEYSDVTDFLSDIELLKFTRAFTQIPCAHLDIGKYVTTRVIERLGSINPAEIPTLIDALQALPLSERLDLAQLFPNLFRDLEMKSVDHEEAKMPRNTQAMDDTRQQAISVMARVMNRLQSGSTSALEELALINAQNSSLHELKLSARPEGLQNRIHESAMHEAQVTHEHLAKCLHLNTIVHKNERIVTIGHNAVGIMGPTGVIRDVGLCDHTKLTKEAPFSTTVLEDVRNRLQLGLTNGLFFEMVDEEILRGISANTSKQEFWKHVFPDLQENQLSEFLEAMWEERKARTNGARTLLAEAQTSIAERVQSMRSFTDAIAAMMEGIRQDAFLKEFDVYLKRFNFFQSVEIPALAGENAMQKKKGMPHRAMQAIDCLILAADHQTVTTEKIAKTVPSEVATPQTSPALASLKKIRDQAYEKDRRHAAAFQKRQSEESAQYQTTILGSTLALQRLNQELQKKNGKKLLIAALNKLESSYLDTLPSVDLLPTEKFLCDSRFYPFEASEQEEEIKTFALLHSPEMRRSLEEQLEISYNDLSLQSLFQLGRFLRTKKPEDFLDMRIVLRAQELPPHGPDAKKNLVTSFLACAEDLELGNTVLQLGKFDVADPVFSAYAHLVATAEETAQVLSEELQSNNPQSSISQHDLYRHLLRRGNRLLHHVAELSRTEENRPEKMRDAARALEAESGKVSAARMFFISASNMLRSGKEIDLRSSSQEQEFILQALNASGGKASFLRALHEKDALEPIPEIFWRVDRTAEEYNERFGFDVTKFLDTYSTDDLQLLVEFGPGNGTFKKHRSEETKGYLDVAMCDRLYYPVSTFIQNTIDFAILRADGVHLTPEQQEELCDFLYRIVTIKDGQTNLDHIENDDAVIQALREDPRNITDIMIAKSSQFQTVNAVPRGTGARNERGEYIYTEKMPRPSGAHFDAACRLLSTDMRKYLKTSGSEFDVFDAIPAYPAGTILSDFSGVKNLAHHQIDAALGVRSTVYLEGEVYTDFMSSMTKTLTEDGLYIDDNIRENHGFRYRLSELKKVEQQTGYPLMVIMGPQLEGNDLGETPEPRAVVMTTSQAKITYMTSNLSPGFSIRSLSDVLVDHTYLEGLAEKGRINLDTLQV